jgi:aminobenzoyl-glutamate transport protein
MSEAAAEKRGFTAKMLDGIETVGNKVPHPAIIFAGLCVLVIVVSAILGAFNVSVTYEVAELPPIEAPVGELGGSTQPEVNVPPSYEEPHVEIHTETTEVKSLLSIAGLRFIFSSFVTNFANFSVVAVIFVAMIGVGVAEKAGLMAALIRKLVKVAPERLIAFIIVFIGVLSSVASDAGYLILIPLGAAAFLSLGRHPLAGLAAAYAGVSAVFAVNVLITPIDSLLTEITNETIALVPGAKPISVTSNLWFAIVSSFFIALVVTVVTERLIEPRLGKYEPEPAAGPGGSAGIATMDIPDESEEQAALLGDEARGLRFTLWGVLACIGVIILLTAPPGAPLRDPESDAIIGNTPFMDSLIFLITLIFLVAGICYGWGAKTVNTSVGVINAITETFASLAGLIFMLLLISQFIAYFNFSNMPTVIAVKMADALERADIGAIWLLILFILVIALLDIIIPGVVPKWAIFAPIFIPLFYRLGVAPQTVLAAYRVGDSPMNVITPLMVYLPFIVVVAQRYKRDAGLGTIIAIMLPYTLVTLVVWTVFYVIWYLIGIPFGPGYPVQL